MQKLTPGHRGAPDILTEGHVSIWTHPSICALLILVGIPADAQQSEPDDVLYGYLVSGSDSTFARYEFRWQQSSLEITFAPYGQVPAPLEDVQLTGGNDELSFRWPNGALCELDRGSTEGWSWRGMVEVHWAGRCSAATGDVWEITVGSESEPDFGQFLPASEADMRIIERAGQLLAHANVWNHKDDRVCEDDDRIRKWSLFCALYRSSLELTGDYLHARRAMDLVRQAIRESTGLHYVHTLRDYNNHPETTLDQIHERLREAHAKVRREVSNPIRRNELERH